MNVSGELPHLMLRGSRDLSRWLEPRDPMRPDGEDLVCCAVQVHDIGLEADIKVITWGNDDLPGFLRGQADDFHGWAGSRQWRSLGDQIRIQPTHDRRGHVTLLFRLRDRH